MSVRVYLPTTLPTLAGHVADGAIPATDEVFTAADESEESEYAALMAAAEASAEMLTGLHRGSTAPRGGGGRGVGPR